MRWYILLLSTVAATLFGKDQYPPIPWERAVNSGAQYNLKEVSVGGGAVNQAGHTFIMGDFIDSIRPDYNNPSLIEYAAGCANFIARYDMPMGI